MSIRYVNGKRTLEYTPEELLARKVNEILRAGIAPNGIRITLGGSR